MSVRLSPRLQAVAAAVPPGARVIDVGTDHALVPVWLVQTGRAAHVWASDIRPGPLENAASLIRRTGTGGHIGLRLTDGLQGFGPEDGDTVILAGMGGETMCSILAAAPWIQEKTLLILEPQSKSEVLRRWLGENGCVITSERLVKDAGRVYPILHARGGAAPAYSQGELRTGLLAQISADPLFLEYLDILIKRAETAAPYEEGARALLEEYKAMKGALL